MTRRTFSRSRRLRKPVPRSTIQVMIEQLEERCVPDASGLDPALDYGSDPGYSAGSYDTGTANLGIDSGSTSADAGFGSWSGNSYGGSDNTGSLDASGLGGSGFNLGGSTLDAFSSGGLGLDTAAGNFQGGGNYDTGLSGYNLGGYSGGLQDYGGLGGWNLGSLGDSGFNLGSDTGLFQNFTGGYGLDAFGAGGFGAGGYSLGADYNSFQDYSGLGSNFGLGGYGDFSSFGSSALGGYGFGIDYSGLQNFGLGNGWGFGAPDSSFGWGTYNLGIDYSGLQNLGGGTFDASFLGAGGYSFGTGDARFQDFLGTAGDSGTGIFNHTDYGLGLDATGWQALGGWGTQDSAGQAGNPYNLGVDYQGLSELAGTDLTSSATPAATASPLGVDYGGLQDPGNSLTVNTPTDQAGSSGLPACNLGVDYSGLQDFSGLNVQPADGTGVGPYRLGVDTSGLQNAGDTGADQGGANLGVDTSGLQDLARNNPVPAAADPQATGTDTAGPDAGLIGRAGAAVQQGIQSAENAVADVANQARTLAQEANHIVANVVGDKVDQLSAAWKSGDSNQFLNDFKSLKEAYATTDSVVDALANPTSIDKVGKALNDVLSNKEVMDSQPGNASDKADQKLAKDALDFALSLPTRGENASKILNTPVTASGEEWAKAWQAEKGSTWSGDVVDKLLTKAFQLGDDAAKVGWSGLIDRLSDAGLAAVERLNINPYDPNSFGGNKDDQQAGQRLVNILSNYVDGGVKAAAKAGVDSILEAGQLGSQLMPGVIDKLSDAGLAAANALHLDQTALNRLDAIGSALVHGDLTGAAKASVAPILEAGDLLGQSYFPGLSDRLSDWLVNQADAWHLNPYGWRAPAQGSPQLPRDNTPLP
jgi:hypothetical protein